MFPALLQAVGTHIEMGGAFLSAAEGREQRVFSTAYLLTSSLHKHLINEGWEGVTRQVEWLIWQSQLPPVIKSLLKDSQGGGLLLSGRRKWQRDISRVSNHLAVW